MFSETARQVLFLSSVFLLHFVVMAMCTAGIIGRNSTLLWRVFCAVTGTGFHGATLFGLATSKDGVSLDWAMMLVALADTLVLFGWLVFFRRPVTTRTS
jgi:hypothetical protein